jgi:hypothetical protein
MIGGSLYKAQPRLDNFGKPKIGNDGKPSTAFNFGYAIPKSSAGDWRQLDWGAQIYAVGKLASPGVCESPGFAWKVTDGDSTVQNKKGKRPCDREGYAGHWVLWFSQSWAPKVVAKDGTEDPALTFTEAVVPGDNIQVYMAVKSNMPSPTPGVYLNPIAVAFQSKGTRIELRDAVDTRAVFGGGASAPAVPAVPNVAFLGVPPPAHVMTPAANGVAYEQFITNGWTDALLVQHGMMVG